MKNFGIWILVCFHCLHGAAKKKGVEGVGTLALNHGYTRRVTVGCVTPVTATLNPSSVVYQSDFMKTECNKNRIK